MVAFYYFGKFNSPFPIFNDNALLGLPARFFISNSLSSGIFPLWDPYLGAGVALHSIYTSIGMSPIIWILSVIGNYDINLFLTEIIILNLLGFLGMYLWLRNRSSRLITIVGALSYSLSPYMILQSKINLEAVGSSIAIPWICLGTYQIIKKNHAGIPMLAGGLGIAFTSGYLGMNVLMLELLAVWGLILALLWPIKILNFFKKPVDKSDLKKIIVYFLIAITLFLSSILLLISETFSNISIDFFIKRSIDPFAAAIKLESIRNLFDNKVNPFVPDQFAAHAVMLYLPSLVIGGIIYGIMKPTKFFIGTFIAFVFSLCACLSKEYFLARFLVEFLPGFSSIRYHSWLSILLIFLLITAFSQGIAGLITRRSFLNKIYIAVGITLLITFLTYLSMEDRDFSYIAISGSIALTSLLLIQYLPGAERSYSFLISSALVIMCLLQLLIANTRFDNIGFNQRFNVQNEDAQKIQAEIVVNASTRFSALKNTRDLSPLDSTNPHYSRNIVVEGYLPQRSPSINKLITQGEIGILKYYLVDHSGKPITYQLKAINANSMRIKILDELKDEKIIVTIPYSKGWKAVDSQGINIPLEINELGLMQMAPKPGQEEITLEYGSLFSYMLLFISFLSWFLIFIWSLNIFIKNFNKTK
jgi:hypothetical protein